MKKRKTWRRLPAPLIDAINPVVMPKRGEWVEVMGIRGKWFRIVIKATATRY